MYSPETLATLGTQDTGHTISRTICPVSCVPNVSSVSGLYILDCLIRFLKRLITTNGMSCVLCTQCCQCLWTVHS
jgi:hypothetical protein